MVSKLEKPWYVLLAAEVEAALPSDLQVAAHFYPDRTGEFLQLDFPKITLTREDFPRILAVIRPFCGTFENRLECEVDLLVFKFPKPAPKEAAASNSQPQKSTPKDTKAKPEFKDVPLPKNLKAPEPVDTKTAEPTAEKPAPQPSQTQSQPAIKAPKQPSPISIYRGKYCSACEDQGTCRLPSNTGQMQLCVRMLELQFLDGIAEKLQKNFALADLDVRLKKIELAISSQSSLATHQMGRQQTPPPSQPPKVQRDTNPHEGFEEDGLVWVKVFDGANVKFLKAYEKDNQGRQRFADLAKWITDKKDKPYAKLHYLSEECNVFLWNFNQGPPAIGKSRCKNR